MEMVTLHPENFDKVTNIGGHQRRFVEYLKHRNNLFVIARMVVGKLDIVCAAFIEDDISEPANRNIVKNLYRYGIISFPIIEFNLK